MKKIFGNLELEIEELRIIEGRPEYLRLFWPLYLLGAIFERLVNSTKLLETLRCVILVRISKYNRTQAGQ